MPQQAVPATTKIARPLCHIAAQGADFLFILSLCARRYPGTLGAQPHHTKPRCRSGCGS